MFWPSVIRSLEPKIKNFKDVPNLEPESLYYRDHAECSYCGKPLTIPELTMDHVIPESKGGAKKWDNIVAACGACNSRKGNNLPQGKWVPKRSPYTPTIWDILKIRKNYPITVPDENWVPWLGDWRGEVMVKESYAAL
jgi:5-methylcytosine-specific restriction endonuclease McrA